MEPKTAESEAAQWARMVASEQEAAAAGLVSAPNAASRQWIEQVTGEVSIPCCPADRFRFPSIERVEFKLAAARHFLDKLRDMRTEGWWKYKDFDLHLALDCFLLELMGAKEALLQFINTFFDLRLSEEDVKLGNINTALKARGVRSKAVDCLNKLANNNESWFWKLNDLRNEVAHRRKPDMIHETLPQRREVNLYLCNTHDLDALSELFGERRAESEVVHYCQRSYERMLKVIKVLFRLLEDDIKECIRETR